MTALHPAIEAVRYLADRCDWAEAKDGAGMAVTESGILADLTAKLLSKGAA